MKTAMSAIIPAAGMSSRMSALKPLMSMGETTVIEQVVRMFRSAGIEDICVVTGFRAEDVSSVLTPLNVRNVVNESWASGMFSSIKAGIDSLETDRDAFFILPTDIPLVRPGTVRALLVAYQPAHILHPVFQGRRGHPPLISSCFRQKILNFDGDGGLRSFMEQHELSAVDVPVADGGVLLDMDTPQDYQIIRSRYQRRHIPASDECMAMMTDIFHANKKIIDHCLAVAQVALNLGKEMNSVGFDLDLDLVVAAGLLHDLARGQVDHAGVAEQILNKLGYREIAGIVGAHMDISLKEGESIREKEIVYLADKLVCGGRLVTLNSRFGAKMKEHEANLDRRRDIKRRLGNALKIKSQLEQWTGKSLESMMNKLTAEQTDDICAQTRSC